MRLSAIALILATLLVSACANTGLRNLEQQGEGPDEFIVQPVKPLQQPENFNNLPQPTPGQSNLADARPLAEGVAALGGRLDQGGAVPAADSGLVGYAGRFGVNSGIRQQLASEDADFRRRRGRLTQIRLVPVDRYAQVYQRQALDPQREAARYRRAGVPPPTAPP